MNKKGFTLTELIVVIVIIGIISLITIPNIMKALQKSREQNGETIEKLLVHNLELYNNDYKEDLWCLEKSYCTDDDEIDDGKSNTIVSVKYISYKDLSFVNPDIDMGDCLLQNVTDEETGENTSLSITKIEIITNPGTENEKHDYKYTYNHAFHFLYQDL